MEETIEKLSTEQLEDITKFAAGLAYAYPGNNFYSPFLSNQLLQSLNTVKGVPSTEQIKEAFDAEGIEIPFNQMDVNIRTMEK